MNENFATEFVSKLSGKLGTEEMKIVLDELRVFAEGYDIGKKTTDIAVCDDCIPTCYKVYMVSKKIEGLSEGTLKIYHHHLRQFFETTRKPLKEITTNDIRIYLYNVQEQKGISDRTLESKRAAINAFMEWCYDEGYILKNPCKAIKGIKFEEKERTALTPVELELVRMACETYREKAIIEMFYSTGCRVSEMVNLNRDDVNFETGEVHLFGKGKKHRTAYLNAKAEVVLKKYLLSRTDTNEALFVTKKKPYNRITKAGLEYIVREIGKKSELERNLFPHLIRHTTATHALNRGMNAATLQKLLGHREISTTMIYAKTSREMIKYEFKRYVA